MPTTWTIAIDWDRNGNFTGTNDDVTNRVVKAEWILGFRESYREIAHDSTLKLTLVNNDKLYSPENSGGALNGKLVPLRPVRIQV